MRIALLVIGIFIGGLFNLSVLSAYERIVSLSPQVTESLFLLGEEQSVVGVTDYCRRPKDAQKKTKVGTPLRPDIERIIALNPDLVIGSREGNPLLIMERIRRAGIPVHYFRRPMNFSGLIQNFLSLSEIVGKSKEGKMIVQSVSKALEKISRRGKKRVLWQVGAEPLIVASTASFVSDIIVYSGGVNIIDTKLPYPRLSREEVVAKAPDVIVIMDMGYDMDNEIDRWKRYVNCATFVVMDPYIVGSTTPISFLRAVEKLEKAFRSLPVLRVKDGDDR